MDLYVEVNAHDAAGSGRPLILAPGHGLRVIRCG
jgi:hypothetical protein